MIQRWKPGKIVELEAITSIAETLGARKIEPKQFDIDSHHVSDLVTVFDDSAVRALREILETEKHLTEPAASCSVAALTDCNIKDSPMREYCGRTLRCKH